MFPKVFIDLLMVYLTQNQTMEFNLEARCKKRRLTWWYMYITSKTEFQMISDAIHSYTLTKS